MRQLLLVISDGADAADKRNDVIVFATVPDLSPPESRGIKRIPDVLIKLRMYAYLVEKPAGVFPCNSCWEKPNNCYG